MTPEQISANLNQEHIGAAAKWAAERLSTFGSARVDLTPGDMTRYEIIIVAPGPRFGENGDSREWSVTLANCDGQTYPWMGHGGMHHEYVGQKWVRKNQLWTAVVLTDFLNALAKEMAE